ncbi:BTAD domain-containing putative transcriptional regulator [Deinococcus sp.]|uniref:BTAD domain-containing putative transcriptional regulator n=1 Tax=Deinococcus sp. TaxID=47478 RepID=UPI003CC61E5C
MLGVPQITLLGQPVTFRTRKTLALLVYLALESGLHPRDELAELLWPGQPDTARSALRGALHHLQTALAPTRELKLSPGGVELPRGEHLWVDALALEARASDRTRPPPAEAAELWHGEFLKGFSLPDVPTWDDWAQTQTQHWSERFDVLLARLCDAQLRAGQLWDAMETAQRRVRHDPLNENCYRQLIRAQLAAGLNAETVVTQRECAEVLRRELGLEPSFGPPGVPRPVAGPRPALAPAAARRVLVGREVELRRLDEAWDAMPVFFLAGEAGMGKTALAEEFLARHPELACFRSDAQPVDAGIPFALQARNVRHSLPFLGEAQPPASVLRELSRIVPELWPQPPEPLRSPEQRLRLFEALIDFFGLFDPHVTCFGENLHWWDRESNAMGTYAVVNGRARNAFTRTILTYRPSLLPRDMLETMLSAVKAGGGVLIEVPPLTADHVHELLAHLEPRVSTALAGRLHEYTGGNALFVSETARLLQARGGLFQADFTELPQSPRIRDVIAERLAQLAPDARDLTRVAAVAGMDFSFGLAARVLATDDMALASAFETLDTVGLFRDGRFAHDLLRDAAYELMPVAARTVLHGRVLDAVRGEGVPAARLAQHAVGGRRWREGREWLLQANREARDVLADAEADAFARQAAALPED